MQIKKDERNEIKSTSHLRYRSAFQIYGCILRDRVVRLSWPVGSILTSNKKQRRNRPCRNVP